VDLIEEMRVGDVVAGGGVDEDGGGGRGCRGLGKEEREGVLGEREGLGRWRKWNPRAEGVEGVGIWAEAAARVDLTAAIRCFVVGHWDGWLWCMDSMEDIAVVVSCGWLRVGEGNRDVVKYD
jgi:hypothetical protein